MPKDPTLSVLSKLCFSSWIPVEESHAIHKKESPLELQKNGMLTPPFSANFNKQTNKCIYFLLKSLLCYIVHVFHTELGLLLGTSEVLMLLVTSQRVDLKNCTILHTVPKRWGMSKKERNDFSSSGHFACQRRILFHVGTLAKGILHNCGIFIYRTRKLILNSGTLCTEWRTDRLLLKRNPNW